jgi:hypothetical protein
MVSPKASQASHGRMQARHHCGIIGLMRPSSIVIEARRHNVSMWSNRQGFSHREADAKSLVYCGQKDNPTRCGS